MPDAHTVLSPVIRNDPKFYPFFKDCIGAIDGTHIPVTVPFGQVRPWMNRKGYLSQNVLAACSFDMKFTYLQAGWEGSVSDSAMWDHARNTSLAIPPGKFFLADAGFPLSDSSMVPYRGIRYHLREWDRVDNK